MICDSCHGTGWIKRELRDPLPVAEEPRQPGHPPVFIEIIAIRAPCPECGGSGRSHCCEGERPGNDGDTCG